MDNFKNYYKKQPSNNHRELNWNFAMGTAHVQATIPGQTKSYELVVSTYQMCILSLFNYFEKLSVKEIEEHMGFDAETCKKNLQSLMFAGKGQTKILSVKDNVFQVNKGFKS